MIQGSEEWYAARLGKVTASRIADLMATTRSGYGASRANYMAELIVERLTGAPAERFENAAMRWGTETEPHARAAYEFLTGAEVVEVGLVGHPSIQMAGASPDGLVGDDGMVEFKCPNTATHIQTLLTKTVSGKHIKQMQFQMDCADRKWNDFVSFDPRMPPHLQIWIHRVKADKKAQAKIREEVLDFLAELNEQIKKLEAT